MDRSRAMRLITVDDIDGDMLILNPVTRAISSVTSRTVAPCRKLTDTGRTRAVDGFRSDSLPAAEDDWIGVASDKQPAVQAMASRSGIRMFLQDGLDTSVDESGIHDVRVTM